MGDSLSAGYGLSTEQGWVALLEDRIEADKPGWRVVNASISGETTAGGSARIVREVLRVKPAVVVIELGANDRSEEHTSELQSLMRISYAVFCLKKKNKNIMKTYN